MHSKVCGRRPTKFSSGVGWKEVTPEKPFTPATAMNCLPQSLPDLLNHLALVGEFSGGELGVDEVFAHGQFKAAAGGGLQLEAGDLLLELRQKLGRQTDGRGLIVSSRAVAKSEFHGRSVPSGLKNYFFFAGFFFGDAGDFFADFLLALPADAFLAAFLLPPKIESQFEAYWSFDPTRTIVTALVPWAGRKVILERE